MQVIDAGSLPEVLASLGAANAQVQRAAAWAAKHISAHGTHTANQVASAGALPALIALMQAAESSSPTFNTAFAATSEILAHCSLLSPVLPAIKIGTPDHTLTAALRACLRMMQDSVAARREFVTSGALMILQQPDLPLDAEGHDIALALNGLYPPAVIDYYRQQSVAAVVAR